MILNRIVKNDNGLFGEIELPSGLILHTLELNWNNNKPNISCIPSNSYHCEIVSSPKFGEVYQVKNVPNRTHILIHAGNWISDIQGCILVGISRDDTRLYDSKKAVKKLIDELKGKPFNLIIRDNYNAE